MVESTKDIWSKPFSRMIHTDLFFIFICCFHFDQIFNRFTAFEWFMRTCIEHEYNSLQLNLSIETNLEWIISNNSHQLTSTNVEYFRDLLLQNSSKTHSKKNCKDSSTRNEDLYHTTNIMYTKNNIFFIQTIIILDTISIFDGFSIGLKKRDKEFSKKNGWPCLPHVHRLTVRLTMFFLPQSCPRLTLWITFPWLTKKTKEGMERFSLLE